MRPRVLHCLIAAMSLGMAVAGCSAPNPAYHGREPAADPPDAAETIDGLAPTKSDAGRAAAAPAPTLLPDAGSAAITVAPPPDLTSDLVGYWKFDDGAGTRAADSSDNGNHGTINDLDVEVAWTTGKSGTALEIPFAETAVTRGVRVPASSSINAIERFTIAAWVYRMSNVMVHTCVLSRQLGSTRNEVYSLTFSADELFLYATPDAALGTNGHLLKAGRSSRLNDWMHVAGTFDGAELRLYMDGEPIASRAYTVRLASSTNPVYIGNNVNTGMNADPLGGRVDEVVLYGRALSPVAIRALFDGATPR